MSLSERINNDMKEAMKKQDKFTLSVLRMLKSSLQLEAISLKKELSDSEVIAVVKRGVKQRKDSILEYQKFNKEEEINNLNHEIDILKSYLPEEISLEEVRTKVNEVFTELNPSSMKDMGIVMKRLTDEIGSVADMSVVSKMVKEKLLNK